MFVRIALSALSCGAPFVVLSDNVPDWISGLAWFYILLMMVIGVVALKADQVITWCDRKEKDIQVKIAQREDRKRNKE